MDGPHKKVIAFRAEIYPRALRRIYCLHVLSALRRRRETLRWRDRMRRLLSRLVTAAPGRLGSPSVPTDEGLPSMAGRGADERGRKLAGSGELRSLSAPGSTVPRRKVAAGGAPRGECADRKVHARFASVEYLQRLTALRSLML